MIEYDIDNGIASYGLMIGDHRAYQCGCGAEATLLYLTYIFADPKIRRVYVTVISSNRRAQQLIEEVGFQKEGVLRQHSVLASGEICDFYYYGMLKEEWGRYQDSFSDILKTARYEKF